MLSVGLVFITDEQFYGEDCHDSKNQQNHHVGIRRSHTQIEKNSNNTSSNSNYSSFLNFLDQRDRIQKKTFTKWMNQYLSKVGHRVDDLYEDLRDGVNLIVLLEILSGDKIVSKNNIKKYKFF